LVSISIERRRGTEPARSASLSRNPDGLWRIDSPRRGDADPDSVERLFLAITSPAVISSSAKPLTEANAPVAFTIDLGKADGRHTRLTTFQAPLGRPICARIESTGDFLISPIEFGTKIPDPADFLPAGLWVSAGRTATSIEVNGRVHYSLHSKGAGEWTNDDGRSSPFEIEDVPGAITGRQAMSHPPPGETATGLDKPAATARLCAGNDCREFRFALVAADGGTRYFAQGPDMDPIELRSEAWKLLVEGPFVGRAVRSNPSERSKQ
jgi:hypothetical protein